VAFRAKYNYDETRFGAVHADTFLLVEVPRLTTPFVAFSASHPECPTDMVLLLSNGAEPAGVSATFLVHGVGPRLRAELATILQAAYPGMILRPASESPGTLRGAFRFGAAQLNDATARAIIGFVQENGLRETWVRTERGTTTFRVHVQEASKAAPLADGLRSHLAAAGAGGQVVVMTARAEASAGWQQLMQPRPAGP